MKIFFFGGSFDPPHKGHLSIIQSCIAESEKLILLPTKKSPMKDHIPIASSYHRIQMLELLIQDIKHPIVIDDWEINNSKPNYTYSTIKYLQKKYFDSTLFMVIGGDQLEQFCNWKNHEKIMDIVKIVAFNRSNYKFKSLNGTQINWIQNFKNTTSSSSIREEILQGNIHIEGLTKEIQQYILDNKLYGYKS